MRKRLGVLTILLGAAACQRPQPLSSFGAVPAFELTSASGRPFDRKSLDGKIWVADFIFTTCSGPCPRMSSQMRQVQSALGGQPDVKLVSFTVDPEHDTPAVLAAYAQRYRAEPDRWYFLTGDESRLNFLSRNVFKLSSVDGSLTHSTRLVLVDRRGRIRGYYGTSEDEGAIPRLLADIRRLEREPA